jgi:prevent-host-death family protein
VGDAEPFYCETLKYIENLQAAGVTANVDVYPDGYHAFDLMEPDDRRSIRAAEKFCEAFMYAKAHYFAPQEKQPSEISEIAHKEQEPILITKNGYSDLVVMSSELYDRFARINRIDQAIYESEKEMQEDMR